MPEENEAYELGLLIGDSIANMFKMVAKIDNITIQEAVDRWVESYIADKIIEATWNEE